MNKRSLDIAALDWKDAFGSVSHQLLIINSERLGTSSRLKNLIIDSYKETKIRIWIVGSVSRSINRKKC
jgi:hypothetical protein